MNGRQGNRLDDRRYEIRSLFLQAELSRFGQNLTDLSRVEHPMGKSAKSTIIRLRLLEADQGDLAAGVQENAHAVYSSPVRGCDSRLSFQLLSCFSMRITLPASTWNIR